MCLAAAARGVELPSTATVAVSLGAAFVDFHPQLWTGLISGAARCASGVSFAANDIAGVHSLLVEEKRPKRKAKPPGVLGTLPASRPERLGTPRGKPAPAKKPKAVRPGASSLRPKPDATPPPRPLGAPRGTELVTTTIRAAGELA